MIPKDNDERTKRVKLIFNPNAGNKERSGVLLMDILKQLQNYKVLTEPYILSLDCDIELVIREAIEQKISMIVVCGGDGTISLVSKYLMDTNITLGIIPKGTQNNIALSLGIPIDIDAAVDILFTGRRTKIDMGIITLNKKRIPFIEVCSIGIISALFSSGDEIQHGKISRIGDFFTTFTDFLPSEIQLLANDKKEVKVPGHAVLISNMPYFGQNYKVSEDNSFKDGLFDVLFLDNSSKRDLISYIIKGSGINTQDDQNIVRFRVKSIIIDSKPPMPIMADGKSLGEGRARFDIKENALSLMVKENERQNFNKSGDNIEQP